MATVVEVNPQSDLLTEVQQLWRAHSATLGFLPDGAFDQYAREKSILAARDNNGGMSGYLIYRTTNKYQVSIVQLCVAPAVRGQGVARLLFEALKPRVAKYDEIVVRCRRDYEANKLWPRLNFVAAGEQSGRGRERKVLTIWHYKLNNLPLLEAMSRRSDSDVLRVAIDANIFFDLDTNSPGREESKSLQADWLGIELCLTDETLNEVDRQEDHSKRKYQRSRIQQFRVLPHDKRREEEILGDLCELMPEWTSVNDQSDLKQIAKTIASDLIYFVTRDERLLRQADVIYEQYGLSILPPLDIIHHIDALRREKDYRPKRFVTAGISESKPRGEEDLDQIVELIHSGERISSPRRQTQGRIREVIANVQRHEVSCIKSTDGALIAAYAIDRSIPGMLRLPLFAMADSDLGRTAARHLAEKIIILASKDQRALVAVDDMAGGQRVAEALSDAGFLKSNASWIKLSLRTVAAPNEVVAKVVDIGEHYTDAREPAANATQSLQSLSQNSTASPDDWLRVERALWPAKITGTGLPCFIIPIEPRWAKELFDVGLSELTLFGPDPFLSMNSENAYYSAAKSASLKAPGRVLWYVSDQKSYPDSKSLRACSYLDEVIMDKPKELFRRFRRLGVYTWQDVRARAGDDLGKEIVAFKFSKTELFKKPLPWNQLQDVLFRHRGKRHPLVSPLRVDEALFVELYKTATGIA